MKKRNLFPIILLCIILHNSHSIYTAEESKDDHNIIDISDIANQYPILDEGFKILQGIDANVPSFHDKVQSQLIQKNETNFGEVIQDAQDYIADNMQERFLHMLENEIALAKDLYIKFDRNQLYSPLNGRIFYEQIYNIPTIHQAIITSLNQANDPVFAYLLKYQHIFLPYIFYTLLQNNWILLLNIVNNAIKFNHVPLAAILFINIEDKQYNIRKHLQDAIENYSIPSVSLLLEKTPIELHQQFSFLTDRAILNNDTEMLQLLFSRGVPPSNTILNTAINKNDITTVKALIALHVNIEEKNNEGITPLINAINKKNIEIVDALLQAGADANNPTTFQAEQPVTFDGLIAQHIDPSGKIVATKTQQLPGSLPNFNEKFPEITVQRDLYGYTPLQEAVYINSLEIAQLLIAHGADVNVSNIFDGTALQIAQRYNLHEIAQLLQAHGAIHFTPHQRDLNILLRQGPDLFDAWFDDFFNSNQQFNLKYQELTSSNISPIDSLLDPITESKIKNQRSKKPLEIVNLNISQTNKRSRDDDNSEEDSHIVTTMPHVRKKYN